MYGCERWTLMAADKKMITAFEMTAYRRMMAVRLSAGGSTTVIT